MIQRVSSLEQINTVVSLAHEVWHEYFPSVITEGQINYMLTTWLLFSTKTCLNTTPLQSPVVPRLQTS